MGKTYDHITDKLAQFIQAQHMFFVATAPLSGAGHVNVSPKGLDTFKILGPNQVAYLDLGGSGIETQAHLQENGRITLMFCAFSGKANIVRLYGRGRAYDFDHPDYAQKLAWFPGYSRARSVMEIDVSHISDSCGWGVPLYDYQGQREQLTRWSENYTPDEWKSRRYAKNAQSIDGLPGLVKPQ